MEREEDITERQRGEEGLLLKVRETPDAPEGLRV